MLPLYPCLGMVYLYIALLRCFDYVTCCVIWLCFVLLLGYCCLFACYLYCCCFSFIFGVCFYGGFCFCCGIIVFGVVLLCYFGLALVLGLAVDLFDDVCYFGFCYWWVSWLLVVNSVVLVSNDLLQVVLICVFAGCLRGTVWLFVRLNLGCYVVLVCCVYLVFIWFRFACLGWLVCVGECCVCWLFDLRLIVYNFWYGFDCYGVCVCWRYLVVV